MNAIVAIAQVNYVSNFASPMKDAQLIVRIVNAAVLIPLLFSCITLPRRPEVLYKGEKVDSEWSTSVLSRYTWSWVNDLLKTAKRKGDLDPEDIPRPGHSIRVESLVEAWYRANHQGGLLQSILKAYGARLVVQWFVIVFRCIVGIGPFWTMLRLVQLLEDRDAGMEASPGLWRLVFLMGLFTLSEQVSSYHSCTALAAFLNQACACWLMFIVVGRLDCVVFDYQTLRSCKRTTLGSYF